MIRYVVCCRFANPIIYELQLRQKSHARSIGVTHATSANSVSASKNGATSKSATLGPVRYRSSRQPLSPSPSHSIRGHSLVSITQGHVAGTSLPLGRKASVRFDEVEGEEDFESAHRDLQSLPTDFVIRAASILQIL